MLSVTADICEQLCTADKGLSSALEFGLKGVNTFPYVLENGPTWRWRNSTVNAHYNGPGYNGQNPAVCSCEF
jgi:hypothetical protein